VIFFKNLCLLVISLTLASCYEDNDCSASSSSAVDIYLSFDVDFEGADTLIYNDNEYIGGCESELLTIQKTNASYQPKMQGIRIEQHNNGAKHSARFDSEYSRIDFFTSDFIKFLTPHTFYFWLKPTREGHLAKIGTNNISIVDNKIKIDWGNGVKSLSADIAMDTWQYVAIVDDGINIQLIVNEIATSTPKITLTQGNILQMGSSEFRGNVDKINLINKALTKADITNIYQVTKSEYVTLNNDTLGVANLMQQSQLVAQGRIESVDYILQKDNPVTVLTIKVANLYKGQLPVESQENHKIKVAFSGGLNIKNGDIVKQGHCPDLFHQGQNYLFFIADNGNSHCPFVKNTHGVYQIFDIDNQDYVFNLDGFPVIKFNKNIIKTGVRQNTQFVQNTEKNIEFLRQDDKIYTATLTDNTEIQFCNCLTPFYNYQELAQILLSQQAIKPKNSFAQTVAQVMPSKEAKGVTWATTQLAIKQQQANQSNKSLIATVKEADVTNNEFKSFNGLLNVQLNELPHAVKVSN
jgi:hypothetical protein